MEQPETFYIYIKPITVEGLKQNEEKPHDGKDYVRSGCRVFGATHSSRVYNEKHLATD